MQELKNNACGIPTLKTNRKLPSLDGDQEIMKLNSQLERPIGAKLTPTEISMRQEVVW
jgi:hypothetical protein